MSDHIHEARNAECRQLVNAVTKFDRRCLCEDREIGASRSAAIQLIASELWKNTTCEASGEGQHYNTLEGDALNS